MPQAMPSERNIKKGAGKAMNEVTKMVPDKTALYAAALPDCTISIENIELMKLEEAVLRCL